jgi:hypothetical protein
MLRVATEEDDVYWGAGPMTRRLVTSEAFRSKRTLPTHTTRSIYDRLHLHHPRPLRPHIFLPTMANIQKRGNQPEILKKEAVNPDHLPPQRPSKSVSKQVSPPLSGVSLTTFIYALVALSLAYLLFQSANIASWSLFGAKSTSASARAASGAADAAKDKLYASAKSKAASATAGSGAKVRAHPNLTLGRVR